MRWKGAAAAALVLVALAGCERGSDSRVVVLRMASADPAGIEHHPAVALFVERVARLSRGRLRIALDERRARGEPRDETGLLRDVARGAADLGWAHTRSFEAVGVDSFQALDAPLLVDGYGVQAAVIRSDVPARMLAGVRGAGLQGLGLLAGPLSRPVGTRSPLHGADDYPGLVFGVRRSRVADMAVRALGATPRSASYASVPELYLDVFRRPGPSAALEDDLDTLFFERYGGARPWVTANVGLWPRAMALVANPRRLRALTARQRSWLERAAAQAAWHSTAVADQDAQLTRELCAGGVRFTAATPGAVASLRRAWRPLYARLQRRPATRSFIRRISALRRRAPRPAVPRLPSGCRGELGPRPADGGVRSPLHEGTYRVEITATDLRAAGAAGGGNEPGTATLTLRDGRWRLELTEPGDHVERGTYTGNPLRTAFIGTWPVPDDQFFSIVPTRDGLRFHVVRANDIPFSRAIYASHRWRRIGD